MGNEENKPVGRPTKFKEEFVEQAFKLCLLGATTKELADFFEVSIDTICEWMHVHPEFSEALNGGRERADAQIAKSLYRKALGYSHPETVIHNHNGQIIKTEIIKHYPPDTTACIFWLKNRQPKKWRDKIEVSNEVKLSKADLSEIEQNFLEVMEKARLRQEAVLLERGLSIDEEQQTIEHKNGSEIKE